MAWIKSMEAAQTGPSAVTYLTGSGAATTTISIPANATYLITWNRTNNSDTPTITGCTYVATKTVSNYDLTSIPAAAQPVNPTDNARVFQVNTSGAQTLTQAGSTQVGYLTSPNY